MTEKTKIFYKNPDIDFLLGTMNDKIPSKKEDFKPVPVLNGETQEILKDFYQKKPSSESVRRFEEMLHNQLKAYDDVKKIAKPSLVEVIITITLRKERIFDVDVDNISKTVLDALKGYLYDDDSQVSKLFCHKEVHALNIPGYFIAVTELTNDRRGGIRDFYLFSESEPSLKTNYYKVEYIQTSEANFKKSGGFLLETKDKISFEDIKRHVRKTNEKKDSDITISNLIEIDQETFNKLSL